MAAAATAKCVGNHGKNGNAAITQDWQRVDAGVNTGGAVWAGGVNGDAVGDTMGATDGDNNDNGACYATTYVDGNCNGNTETCAAAAAATDPPLTMATI